MIDKTHIDKTWGNGGPTVFFAPANGFPAAAYEHLIAPLAPDYRIHGWKPRPLWPGTVPTRDWHLLARDIGDFIDRQFPAPILAVGHSIGAVTLLLAAAERPSRFTHLVLLDPVVLPHWMATVLRFAPAFVRERGPRAQGTLKRVDRFADKEEMYKRERRRRSLGNIPDDVLRQIVDSVLIEHPEGGYRLRISKQWEAKLFESPPSIWGALRRPLPPVSVIRGQLSDVFSDAASRRWRQRRPEHRFMEIPDAGHLVPFEKPATVAEFIRNEIGRVLSVDADRSAA